jgi:hypothetical protein
VERGNERALATYLNVGMIDSKYLIMEVDHSRSPQNSAANDDAR